MAEIPVVTHIPPEEKSVFDKFIQSQRSLHIRTSQKIVDEIFMNRPDLKNYIIESRSVSNLIETLRAEVWEEFLKDEIVFNAEVMKNLYKILDTPKVMLNVLIEQNIAGKSGEDLRKSVRDLCGEYAGRVFPYLYALSLSNTNSRRSRAGKTFEAIIYKIYDLLGYRFDSQNRLGRKIFNDVGLGKKVDSVLPGIAEFNQRRNKTIIGTMKTSLRERWQEVAEEIERTKIPEIHLLTVDEDISVNKAAEMGNHNIVIVAFSWIAESEKLKNAKNIVSFEEYFFEEIPGIIEYWKK
ncbi:type II restriction endonuclease [Elizabethkingia anophelis]|uniref:type II restriction endonuclease n=1 Tax=Elizabethkingia anophelis TaxID=1117645 RepID=UPI001C873FF3|nr:type II restriction endonuclease [Elizabethkingia anophelis]